MLFIDTTFNYIVSGYSNNIVNQFHGKTFGLDCKKYKSANCDKSFTVHNQCTVILKLLL